MKFIIVFFITIIYIAQACQGELQCSSTEFKCTPGQPIKLNNCQFCRCAENGHELGPCTKIACPFMPGWDPRNCTVGSTWTRNCNNCCCIEKLGTVCTNNYC